MDSKMSEGPAPAVLQHAVGTTIHADAAGQRIPGGDTQTAPPAAVQFDVVVAPQSIRDALAAAAMDALPDATAILDESGVIVAVNHAWRMFSLDNGGDEASNGVGVSYLQVCDRAAGRGSADARQVAADLRDVLAAATIETELEYPCPSPALGRWFMLRICRLTGPHAGAVVSHVNITRRKGAEDELAHAASHDPLTGLANRNLLHGRLNKALTPRAGRRATATVGLCYIDLDGFKPVNDTYGHAAGDEVLLTVARRLQDQVRPGDTVARLGGDEFAVLIPRTDLTKLTDIADRIRRTLADPHYLHGQSVSVPGSIGVHLAVAGDTVQQSLDLADQAMYAAKQQRRSSSVAARLQPVSSYAVSGTSPGTGVETCGDRSAYSAAYRTRRGSGSRPATRVRAP